MCYRKSIPGNEVLEQKFKAQYLGQPFKRRYHVSAFTEEKLPVIPDRSPNQITLMTWGLIPFWVKDEHQAKDIRKKTANARAETIYEKPVFRHAAEHKHCLVLADGFFEWHEHDSRKYPYYVRLKNHEPFAMAGLWDSWKNSVNGEVFESYTIITTEANQLMKIVHNTKKRMPVILPDGTERRWLNPNLSKDDANEMLMPLDSKYMEAYSISKLITARGKDPNIPEVLTPYSYPGIQAHL